MGEWGSVTLAIAFIAGLLSILSPCVLPLVPAYLSHVSAAAFGAHAQGAKAVWPTLISATLFVTGFSLVFIAFGATASAVGQLLSFNQVTVRRMAAVLVVAFGLHTAGWVRLPFLDRERRIHLRPGPVAPWRSLLIGMAFAAGWTPCVGPILGSILLYAGTAGTLWRGVFLLTAYSAGLAVPFLGLAAAVGRVSAVVPGLTRHAVWIERISGLFLIAIGLLLYFDVFVLLPQWFDYYRWLPT
ncbi:MAG TPA: cytochrome c biogenesis protein CcdA [Limnochordia bacterium]